MKEKSGQSLLWTSMMKQASKLAAHIQIIRFTHIGHISVARWLNS